MINNIPLAETLRPQNIFDLVGQDHLTGENGIITKLLRSADTNRYFPSIILWGPPGCGKTSLARLISKELNRPYFEYSAVNTSVKEIEAKVLNVSKIDQKQKSLYTEQQDKKSTTLSPIVFIDEIHRFNKAQQDALLPHVERGDITFIGATTENPSFEVIAPLLSRTRVLVLNLLDEKSLTTLLEKALVMLNRQFDEKSKEYIVNASNGDARTLLNLIELSVNIEPKELITKEVLTQALQKSALNFDLQGEEFYNTISAFHKSIRGSDPNAALYWLARMLEAGQDPLYIARRLIRAASEDVGLADPNALNIAVSAFNACEKIGVPECNLALAEAVVYLAKSPKSNSLYIAYGKVQEDVKNFGNLPVPMHIRNPVTKLMKGMGYGKNYDYSHNPKGQKNPDIDYLPDKIKDHTYL